MSPAFVAMRAGLVERGLLGADFRLTAAGHAHVEQLMVELRQAEPERDPDGPRVFWRIDLRSNASRAGAGNRRAA